MGASSEGDEAPAETVGLAAVLDDVVATEIGRWIGCQRRAVAARIRAAGEPGAALAASGELATRIAGHLALERALVDVYAEMVRWIGDADPAVCSAIAAILEQQREHVGEVAERLGCAGG